MANTYTATETSTKTDAVEMSAKIAADLNTLRRRCGADNPTNGRILEYQLEATLMLRCKHWKKVQYGYCRQGNIWVPGASLMYKIIDGQLESGQDPGGIVGANVSGCYFDSFSMSNATPIPEEIRKQLPWDRETGEEPSANWQEDRGYLAGALAVKRYMSV